MKTERIYYVTATTHDGKKSWFGQRTNKRDAVKWFKEVASKYRDAKLNCKTTTVEVLLPKSRATDGVWLRGMRVGLPKGEAVATEGRKYNEKLSDAGGEL